MQATFNGFDVSCMFVGIKRKILLDLGVDDRKTQVPI